MSCATENQSIQSANEDGSGPKDMKSVEDFRVKLNGLSENSTVLASQKADGGERGKENGLVSHKTSSKSDHKPREGHHHSSSSKSTGSDKDKHLSSSNSSKHKENSSSSSSKHGTSSSKHKDSSSSSSSKHRDGHSSSSSSKHREGSSSKHSSSSSSSKHKEGTSSSVADKDKSNSSSSKPKDSTSSSSDKQSSSGRSKESSDGKQKDSSSNDKKHKDSSSDKHKDSSSKHKESSDRKHKESSSSSKPKEGSACAKDKTSSSSSTEKSSSKDKSSTSSSKHSSKESSSGDKNKLSSQRTEGDKNASKHKSQSSESKVEIDNSKEKPSKMEKSSGEVKIKKEIVEPESNTNTNAMPSSELSPSKKEELSSAAKTEKSASSSIIQHTIKSESEDDNDDKPLSARKKGSKPTKRAVNLSDNEEDEKERYEDDEEDEDSDVPLSVRNKAKKMKLEKKAVKEPVAPVKAKPVAPVKATAAVKKKAAVKNKKEIKDEEDETNGEPVKKKKKGEEEQEVWKWWEETKGDSSSKWTFLEHKGPMFAPAYEPLPKSVRFYYDGKPMQLSPEAEEVATFYGRMLDHDYTTRDVFNNNFMKDWRKVMTAKEKAEITNIKLCNFHEILDYFKKKSEERKSMSKEEKQKIKKENEEIVKEYGFCIIDRHKEKIGNFRIEPPGLFRGRGDHPKQGMLKKRTNPEDVIINCSKDSKIPPAPPGHKWKEVRHDNTVTWLASWNENIQGSTKYVMLNAASKLKGEKDWQKYETARKLHKCVDKIRAQYQEDWKSKEMRVRQRAVALYFIDKLALRAGNEKEEGETADTVGCCSLRVEHTKLHEEKDGKQYVVEFDFLGKDSIRYQNAIPVEKRVFKNLQLFMENKQPEDDLFDRLNTTILNKHLQELMDGLTAKVFRTFNASKTLSEQLALLTNPDDSPAAKLLAYNRANRAVAILCNHQRAVPKTFEKSMENLMNKIDAKKSEVKQVKKQIKEIKSDYKREKSVKTKTLYDKKKKTLARLEDQLVKLEVQATDKDENKEIALGTSKLNYLDPRISVAWCKKFGVPIEKVYNKTQRDKFRWAIDMATEQFKF